MKAGMLQVLVDEKLADNAQRQGEKLRAQLGELQRDGSRVTAVRGKVLAHSITNSSHCVSLLRWFFTMEQTAMSLTDPWRGCERAGFDECHRHRRARWRQCLRCLHAPEGQRPAGEPCAKGTAGIASCDGCVVLFESG